MKKKQKKFEEILNFTISGILILLGVLLLIFPLFEKIKPNMILYLLFTIYGVIKLIEYIYSELKSDRENLYTAIACLVVAVSGFKFYNDHSATVLSVTLASWIGLMSIIKLIKLDFYHDRGNGMFFINIVTFGLFLFIGLLTSINLYHDVAIQTLILGYFFIINGILNLGEDAVMIFVNSKNFNIKKMK